ncbi:DUF4145 domain-containing protein [Kocuria palustris]|uniref:DUF4145 domain-containing protein n=1 Tax=Kocuria palustris TaxID=71999 RepID=UPI00332AA4C9
MSIEFDQGTGLCPHCGKHVATTTIGHTTIDPAWVSYCKTNPGVLEEHPMSLIVDGGTELVTVETLRCQSCSGLITFLDHLSPDSGPEGQLVMTVDTRTMISPARPPRELPSQAPEAARSLYAEASQCESVGALRGAGVLYRATVEEIVRHQGGQGNDLYKKIDSLQGKLEAEVIEDLHQSRIVGNESIHYGLTFSADEVGDIAELIYEACHVLYAIPAERQAFRDRRKARVAARKAGTSTPSNP